MSTNARRSALIFLLAAVVRLTLVFGFHRYQIGRPEPVRIAVSLGVKGSFADPYAIPTGPTAHAAPLYPAIIAPFYAVWGDTRRADLARIGLNTLAASAEYGLLPQVASALGLGFLPGFLAGLGGALLPLHLWAECSGDFETTWVALFLEGATILFARFLRAPRLDAKHAALGGAFWGLGFLLSPDVLPVLAGLGAIGVWKLRPGPKAAGRWLAAFTAAALLVVAPWTIRNYVWLGGWFFVRDNFGLELYVSNHDGAIPDLTDSAGSDWWIARHPHASVAAALEVRRVGELAFERQKLGQAIGWIRSHPGEFARLTAARVRMFWFPQVPRFRWVFRTATLMALAGWTLLYRRYRLAAAVLGVILAGYSAIYYVVSNTLRYQHPLWWIQVLLIGWLAHKLWLRRLGRRARP